MSTSRTSTIRRVVATAAVTATAATCLAATPTTAAAATAAHGRGHVPARTTAASGFVPVRTLQGEVLAMHSPAKGQLWIAERTADGRLLLEQKDRKTWRTHRLDITLGAADTVDLHGVGANDVWLTAGGQLWHYSARRWTKVATPGGAEATTVFDIRGPVVYVGLSGDKANTGIYTLKGRTWTSLGRPSDHGWEWGPYHRPTDVQVVDGTVFANWSLVQVSSMLSWQSYTYDKGAWTNQFATYSYGHGSYGPMGPWVVPNATTQYYFSANVVPTVDVCRKWTVTGSNWCTTQVVPGAATTLPDGRIVLGGKDFRPERQPMVEGTFVVRGTDDSEQVVPGDPGQGAVAMTTEPGTGSVWAATVDNGVYRLQLWSR